MKDFVFPFIRDAEVEIWLSQGKSAAFQKGAWIFWAFRCQFYDMQYQDIIWSVFTQLRNAPVSQPIGEVSRPVSEDEQRSRQRF